MRPSHATRTGRAASLLLTLLAVLALPLLGVPSSAVAQPPAGGAPTAARDYGACLTAQGTGDLLVLLDTSGSLTETDPTAARVTAAKYLLSSLQGITERSGVDLQVAVAGFDSGYTEAAPFQPLTATSLPALTGVVDSFSGLVEGQETDYWTALEQTRRVLADRQGTQGAQRCQAVAWFSDGVFDIVLTDPPSIKPYAEGLLASEDAVLAAEQAAIASLCAAGGPADQLRGAGIATFGIGLTSDGTDEAAFGLIRGIATGEQTCGTRTDPSPGEFHTAADIDGLLAAFDEILPGPPPLQREEPLCPGALPCDERHTFVLDSSIEAVHVLGQVDVADAEASVVLPSGEVLPLADRAGGSVDRGGVTITWTWPSRRSIVIDIVDRAESAGWTGVWSVVFLDPRATAPGGTSRTSIRIFSDLLPAWTDRPPVLRGGQRVPVTLGLVDGDAAAVDPASILGDLAVSAVFTDPVGRETALTPGVDKTRLADPLTLDLTGVGVGQATLRLTLDLTTAAAQLPDGTLVPGTRLGTQTVDLPLQIEPPLNYPTVGPLVDFGAVEGTEGTASLAVTGPGCVQIASGSPEVTAPAEAGQVRVTGPDAAESCPAPGGALELRLTVDRAATGGVTGTLPVTLVPEGGGEPIEARVAFSADLQRPLNPGVTLITLLVALLLGPGIPFGLLYLTKWLTARVPERPPLKAARVPVTVSGNRVALPDGSDFDVRDGREWAYLDRIGRRVLVHGVELRTRTGWSPFGPASVRAEARGTYVAASSQIPASDRRMRAVLPLAVHRGWVVLHDPAGPPDRAEVLLLVAADQPGSGQQAAVADVRRQLPGVLRELRGAASRRGPGGGAPPPPPPEVPPQPQPQPAGNTFAGYSSDIPGDHR